jgi:hypothetical protein
MRDALLLNPFDGIPEAAPRRQPQAGPRVTPVCAACQSDDIVTHAIVQWSNETQDWQIADTFGQPAHCNTCRSACGVSWVPIN